MNLSASDLLEPVLTFSAGLSSTRDADEIVRAYPGLIDFAQRIATIEKELITNRRVAKVKHLLEFCDLLQNTGGEFVIASTYYGHPLSLACACAEMGVALAVLHHGASEGYRNALCYFGVDLLDTSIVSSANQLYRELDATISSGRIPVIPFDAPFFSRKSWPFLGYHVEVSTLITTYSRRRRFMVLPVFTRLTDGDTVAWKSLQMIEKPDQAHIGQLLEYLEEEIRADALQYRWDSHCCIYSDRAARINALSFLPRAIEWRETFISGSET